MSTTKIEWADAVWNPITGCTPISEACEHCYAKRMANRLAGRFGYPEDEPFRVTFHNNRLDEPLRWKKPQRIFTVSMGDLFHQDVKFEWLEEIFQVIRQCEMVHEFLILTKRPQRVIDYWFWRREKWLGANYNSVFPKNIWLGVTAENQARADERIPVLLQIPAAVRFVSIEPMLGPVDITKYFKQYYCMSCHKILANKETACICRLGRALRRPLHMIIFGGETGPGARPMHPDWVRSLRDQCQSAGVAFFFKGWGDWAQSEFKSYSIFNKHLAGRFETRQCVSSTHRKDVGTLNYYPIPLDYNGEPIGIEKIERIGKKAAGRLLDGREWNEFPPSHDCPY